MSENGHTHTFDLDLAHERIRKHIPLVCVVFLLVVAGAVAYALLAQPFYKATTKMVYQSPTKSSGNLSALASLAGFSMGGSDGDVSAYLGDIIKSADVMAMVLDHPWKVSDPKLGRSWKSAEEQLDTSKPILLEKLWKVKSDTTKVNWQSRKREALLRKLIEDDYITFLQDKKTGVITLTTEFEDPLVALNVNQFLATELNTLLVNKNTRKANANRLFIESRLIEVKANLRDAEYELKAFREKNRTRMDPGVLLEDSRLQRGVQISQEVMIQLYKQYEVAKIEEAKDLPVLDVIDSPRLPMDKFKPKRKVVAVMGAVVGFLLAISSAIVLEMWLERRRRLASLPKQT